MEHLLIDDTESRAHAPAQTMQAAVVVAPRAVRLEERPVPEIGREQVLVRIEGCGVCGSNLPVWEGRPWFTYPLEAGAPGHEGWGFVESVGDDVNALQPGDRVAMLSYHAFATHDVAQASDVVKLPRSLDGVPFPGEPLACAVNVMRRAAIEREDRVAIVGIGFLGSLLTMLSVAAGARVVAVSRREYALTVASRLGANALPLQSPEAVASDCRGYAPDGFDVVIEAVGNQDALDVASALTGVRGRLVIAGYHQDGPRNVDMQNWNWRGIDVINAHERDPAVYREGLELAVSMAAGRAWDARPLMTHTFPLEELSDAMQMMQERPDGFMKAILRP